MQDTVTVFQRHRALREEFDRIVEQYKHAQDFTEKHKLLGQAHEILNESNTLVSMAQQQVDSITRKLANLASTEPFNQWNSNCDIDQVDAS